MHLLRTLITRRIAIATAIVLPVLIIAYAILQPGDTLGLLLAVAGILAIALSDAEAFGLRPPRRHH